MTSRKGKERNGNLFREGPQGLSEESPSQGRTEHSYSDSVRSKTTQLPPQTFIGIPVCA